MGSTIRMTGCRGNRSSLSTDRMIDGGRGRYSISAILFCSLLRQAISYSWVQLDWLRDDGGSNWYRSEQSCFVIARDLRSLAPSRASICKTSWIVGSLF